MVSKHRKHLMDIERRRKLAEEKPGSEVIIHSTQKQETVMNNHIGKTKTFIKKHRKAFIIGGSIVALVLAGAVAHKALKNGRINDTIKNLGVVGFKPASVKAVKKEMKIEMKGAGKRNLKRSMYLKFPEPNRYLITEDGTTTNLRTKRILKPVFDTDGTAWQMHFVEDNQFQINTVERLIEIFAPTFAANAVEVVEAVADVVSEMTS